LPQNVDPVRENIFIYGIQRFVFRNLAGHVPEEERGQKTKQVKKSRTADTYNGDRG
jgi:hypothetical protein